MKISWGKLIGSILLCELAGVVGSVFTVSSIPTWYSTLNKPFFSPSNFLFGPVWVTLYALMGISFYLILQSKSAKKSAAIKVFLTQLFFNAIWSPVFFGLQSPLLGLLIIIALLVSIVLTIKEFYKVNKTAALLLVPYLAWVSFATLLNFSIWRLN